MSCKTGKIKYRYVWFAKKHLQWIAGRSDSTYKPIRVYKCNLCGDYHLTSKQFKTKEERAIIRAIKNFKKE